MKKYVNTENENDIVTMDIILQRYLDNHGNDKGFIEYVASGFCDNLGMIEYRPNK